MSLLDVFDLPQLYTKPSAAVLLDTLALLTSAPPSWECSNEENFTDGVRDLDRIESVKPKPVQVNPEGVTRYLTSVVSSSLRWIQDEEAKEEIWSQASLRLSERSGRTAMGAISRKFRIPKHNGSFELSIHEPTLTGDDLGLKTWAASYLLAKRLHKFKVIKKRSQTSPPVLELGSGTGLVGLAMAALGANVILTDLPSIHSNLSRNTYHNAGIVSQNGGSTQTGVLDWTKPTSCQLCPANTSEISESGKTLTTKFSLILAADSLYAPEHPRMLVDTISVWLSEASDATVIVEFPYRDAYLPEIKEFRERMQRLGLHIVEEGEEKGYDDWGWSGTGEEQGENALVTCWWSCWGRTLKPLECDSASGLPNA